MTFEAVKEISSSVYKIPTAGPEADGTLTWEATTMVVAQVTAGGQQGLGWTYGSGGAKAVIDSQLGPVVRGADPMAVTGAHEAMVRACRNVGRPGVASSAISAVDIALWDLKARLLGVALADLFGRCTDVLIYGSGGFTTYSDEQTVAQLHTWADEWAIPRVKIKIGESWGADPGRDRHRVQLARQAVGDNVELYVDANGGYSRKQAVRMGQALVGEFGVSWFEEPVSSDDLAGLREVHDQCTADIAAGEYGYSPGYFVPLMAAGAVDCVQVDVTRVGGYTDWLAVAHMAAAQNLDVSAHCAPNLHAHVAGSVPHLRHVEYFHDHHRVEQQLFDGALDPQGGVLCPDPGRLGHGLALRSVDAERYRVA